MQPRLRHIGGCLLIESPLLDVLLILMIILIILLMIIVFVFVIHIVIHFSCLRLRRLVVVSLALCLVLSSIVLTLTNEWYSPLLRHRHSFVSYLVLRSTSLYAELTGIEIDKFLGDLVEHLPCRLSERIVILNIFTAILLVELSLELL